MMKSIARLAASLGCLWLTAGTAVVVAEDGAAQRSDDAVQAATEREQLLQQVQAICPVSGQPLGSMGAPIKTSIDDQTTFLCCRGCLGKPVDDKHWAGVQQRLATAQGICPVMKQDLPASPDSIVIDGQPVFVCCPPCQEKIAAEPEAHLAWLETQYRNSLRDTRQIAIQAICPVSGEPLGSMGEPVKVQVGDAHVFLCCQGCVGRDIQPEHWKAIHVNLAAAQGLCPVMENELPKTPKWTVVAGQVVFVCCPPCIEKLQQNPEEYLAKLDQQRAEYLARRDTEGDPQADPAEAVQK